MYRDGKEAKRRGRRGVKKKGDKISPAFSSSAMSCLDCLPLAAALSPLSGPEGRSPITGKSAAANEVSLKQRVQSQGGRRGTEVECQLFPPPPPPPEKKSTRKPSRQHKACQKKTSRLRKSSRLPFSHLALSDTGGATTGADFKAVLTDPRTRCYKMAAPAARRPCGGQTQNPAAPEQHQQLLDTPSVSTMTKPHISSVVRPHVALGEEKKALTMHVSSVVRLESSFEIHRVIILPKIDEEC